MRKMRLVAAVAASVLAVSGCAAGSKPTTHSAANVHKVALEFNGQSWSASLDDSPASKDFLAMMPVTVDMAYFPPIEKAGQLPKRLSTSGQGKGMDPSPGQIAYFAPQNALVVYFGEAPYADGLFVIGQVDNDPAEWSELEGITSITFKKG